MPVYFGHRISKGSSPTSPEAYLDREPKVKAAVKPELAASRSLAPQTESPSLSLPNHTLAKWHTDTKGILEIVKLYSNLDKENLTR